MYLNRFEKLLQFDGPIVVPDSASLGVLNAAFDHHARYQGSGAWRVPRVLPWGNLLGRDFELARLNGAAAEQVDFMLSHDQEVALWQAVIAADRSLDMRNPEQAAPLATEAWRLQHLWGLPSLPPSAFDSADVAAFARWAEAYRERTATLGATDQARVLERSATLLQPTAMLAQGFLAPPPRLEQWLGACGQLHDQRPRGKSGAYTAYAFRDREDELHAALSWAAAQAQRDPTARIALVLDSLRQDEALLRRCCRDVYGSDRDGRQRYFLGARENLAEEPTIRLAMRVLELQPVTRWDTVSEVVCHPLLSGTELEASARAVFDADLRALERYELPLAFVASRLQQVGQCPQLARVLGALMHEHASLPARQRLVAWLKHFEACLKAAGWPGDGDGEPDQIRARNAWGGLCDRLNSLDTVLAPVTRAEALMQLRRLLNDSTLGGVVPSTGVFVVTPLEALTIAPTHVWLAGCESEALVSGERRSPLLPLDQQRAASMPGTDPGRTLWQARAIVDALAAHGVQHCASFAIGDGELRFTPSPLVPQLAAAPIAAANRLVPVAWQQAAAVIDEVDDFLGPPLAPTAILGGGVSALAAQAACAFRGFARHRLNASTVLDPAPGISARRKGTTVHRVLATVWAGLGDRQTLAGLTVADRQQRVRDAVQRDLRPLPFETAVERELFFIERERVLTLVDRWLEFELEREEFAVIASEQAVEVSFAGLSFNTRIDRVDRLADGSTVIVDYKTGKCSVRDWDMPRMNAPQLPLYALTAPHEAIAGIAFAAVDRARPNWLEEPSASSASDGEWSTLAALWQADLALLAAEICSGRAEPAPKRGNETCRNCEQALFCRRVELSNAALQQAPTRAKDQHD
jgi:ATP-dependent helicase/nuclease subunit B